MGGKGSRGWLACSGWLACFEGEIFEGEIARAARAAFPTLYGGVLFGEWAGGNDHDTGNGNGTDCDGKTATMEMMEMTATIMTVTTTMALMMAGVQKGRPLTVRSAAGGDGEKRGRAGAWVGLFCCSSLSLCRFHSPRSRPLFVLWLWVVL